MIVFTVVKSIWAERVICIYSVKLQCLVVYRCWLNKLILDVNLLVLGKEWETIKH